MPLASRWDYEKDRRVAELLDRCALNSAREQSFREGFNRAYGKSFPEDALPREALAASLARHLQGNSPDLSLSFRERIEKAQQELWTWLRDVLCERSWREEVERSRKRG